MKAAACSRRARTSPRLPCRLCQRRRPGSRPRMAGRRLGQVSQPRTVRDYRFRRQHQKERSIFTGLFGQDACALTMAGKVERPAPALPASFRNVRRRMPPLPPASLSFGSSAWNWHLHGAGCLGKVLHLGAALVLVDRTLRLGWWKRHAHRCRLDAGHDGCLAQHDPRIEIGKVRNPHERPGVGSRILEQEQATLLGRPVLRRAMQRPGMVNGHGARFARQRHGLARSRSC